MKTAYIAIIFLAVFQMMVILVNSMGVFPTDGTFYSDLDYNEINSAGNDPLEIFKQIFTPSGRTVAGISVAAGIWAVVIAIATIGTGAAIFTHSFVPAVLAVQAILFIPLVANSLGFFNKLLNNWDQASISYLAVIFSVAFLILIFFTIIETPTHGRS